MKKSLLFIFPVLLSGCELKISSDNDEPVEVTSKSDFSQGADGWLHGFSDYPVADKEIYNLVAGIKPIPDSNGKTGYMIGGSNRSDDLFMYLKRPVRNLVANTRYQVTVDITLWSDAGDGCFGIGGSPGSAVYVKAGASEQEPKQASYYMNIDIGSQSQKGADSEVLGNIVVPGLGCDGSKYGSKNLSLNKQSSFDVISSDDGEVWVYVGTDSGYEGVTHLYYESLNLTLTPL